MLTAKVSHSAKAFHALHATTGRLLCQPLTTYRLAFVHSGEPSCLACKRVIARRWQQAADIRRLAADVLRETEAEYGPLKRSERRTFWRMVEADIAAGTLPGMGGRVAA